MGSDLECPQKKDKKYLGIEEKKEEKNCLLDGD